MRLHAARDLIRDQGTGSLTFAQRAIDEQPVEDFVRAGGPLDLERPGGPAPIGHALF